MSLALYRGMVNVECKESRNVGVRLTATSCSPSTPSRYRRRSSSHAAAQLPYPATNKPGSVGGPPVLRTTASAPQHFGLDLEHAGGGASPSSRKLGAPTAPVPAAPKGEYLAPYGFPPARRHSFDLGCYGAHVERLPRRMLSAWVPHRRPIGAPRMTSA